MAPAARRPAPPPAPGAPALAPASAGHRAQQTRQAERPCVTGFSKEARGQEACFYWTHHHLLLSKQLTESPTGIRWETFSEGSPGPAYPLGRLGGVVSPWCPAVTPGRLLVLSGCGSVSGWPWILDCRHLEMAVCSLTGWPVSGCS